MPTAWLLWGWIRRYKGINFYTIGAIFSKTVCAVTTWGQRGFMGSSERTLCLSGESLTRSRHPSPCPWTAREKRQLSACPQSHLQKWEGHCCAVPSRNASTTALTESRALRLEPHCFPLALRFGAGRSSRAAPPAPLLLGSFTGNGGRSKRLCFGDLVPLMKEWLHFSWPFSSLFGLNWFYE